MQGTPSHVAGLWFRGYRGSGLEFRNYRGTLLIRNCPPPKDHHRALDIGLLYDPRGGQFLMSEVPLYKVYRQASTSPSVTSGETPPSL